MSARIHMRSPHVRLGSSAVALERCAWRWRSHEVLFRASATKNSRDRTYRRLRTLPGRHRQPDIQLRVMHRDGANPLTSAMTSSQCVYEVRRREIHRGVNLIPEFAPSVPIVRTQRNQQRISNPLAWLSGSGHDILVTSVGFGISSSSSLRLTFARTSCLLRRCEVDAS